VDRIEHRAAALRQLLQGPKIVRLVGGHDGLTAKLIHQAGFEGVWASSFAASASHGVPDASILSMTQFLDVAEAMTLAAPLPVIADGDTGFGDARNFAYAVQRYEARGIAGICIEDKQFPKINSFADAKQDLLPAAEFAAKIRAGKQAQAGSQFLVIARTEALIAGGDLDEALERAHRYADAGADAVLVHSKSVHPDQVLKFGAAWDRGVPLVAIPTTYPQVTEVELFDAGYRVVIYANHGIRATVRTVTDTLSALSRAGTAASLEGGLASMAEVFALQGMPAAFKAAP
jgi:phosphoenolpyruvate phosphomutase